MNLNSSCKTLKILSILTIIGSVLVGLFGLLAIAGGGLIASGEGGTAVQEALKNLPVAMTAIQAGGATTLIGMALVIGAAFDLVGGVLGVRGANDPDKIRPAWIFAIIGLIVSVANAVLSIMSGSIVSAICGVVVAGLIFYAANNIKAEVAA